MIDFIPLPYYSDVYINSILISVLLLLLHTYTLSGYERKVFYFNRNFSLLLLVSLILFIGLRPISGRYFTDMSTYALVFRAYMNGMPLYTEGDIGFDFFMFMLAKLGSIDLFFLICAILYILPLYLASKIWFPKYYLFAFIMLLGSFSFYTYGVNGMRNGIATSIFVLGMAYSNRKVLSAAILILAVLIHQSMTLPLVAYIGSFFIKDSKKYFLLWFACIFLSLALGSVWTNLFASLGIGGDKLHGYLTTKPKAGDFSNTGFRFDFLIYGAIPVVTGYYFVIKRKFEDENYKRILHTYIVCNAVWILINKANFSNRFAYLSWFLMAVVVCYPYLKTIFWKNQFYRVGIYTALYFGFTYFMYYLYYL